MSKRGTAYDIRRKLQYVAGHILPPAMLSKLYFRIVLKRKLDLKNPKSFNEKIQWYKLNYCPNNQKVILCADKARVHEYLEEKGLGRMAVPIIGVWKSTDEIDYSKLPNRFVIKCNHGCGYNIVVRDKANFKWNTIKSQLDQWMKEDFGYFNAEPHYLKISKRIVCEEYLGDGSAEFMSDIKVHCFNGEPRFTLVSFERDSSKAAANYVYYDNEWRKLKYSKTPQKDFSRPKSFDEMLEASRVLSKDFPFVRVDFYEVNGKPYIGELTFDPDGGLDNTIYTKADYNMGKMLDLEGLL